MNRFGRRFAISLFGESHGAGVGVVVDGVPAGLPFNLAAIQSALDARRPGGALTSQRQESDRAEILSGVLAAHATAAPLCIFIRNEDTQSADYRDVGRVPRPGHADFTADAATRGFADLRGGGHLSGRLTAPIVAAGAIAQFILDQHGIVCAAHLQQVGQAAAPEIPLDAGSMLTLASKSVLHTAHVSAEETFRSIIETARKDKDSVGGVVDFVVEGLPAGLGDPYFDSVESLLAHLLFSIPAVKAVEFGSGFAGAAARGSANNDAFIVRGVKEKGAGTQEKGAVMPRTNNAGGILGGRTTGAPLRGRVGIKPASSIAQQQDSVDLDTLAPVTVEVKGRHDPCIAIRAVPVVRAALQVVLADLVLQARQDGLLPVPAVRKGGA